MTQTITGLSAREADLLAKLAASGRTIFRPSEIGDLWPDAASLHNVLSELCRGGWLKRIERGLYLLVPLSAGPERLWTEDALVVASRIHQPAAIAYWSAMRFWNFTEQLPYTVFVQSPVRKFNSRLIVGGVHFHVVTVVNSRFFGLAEREIGGHKICVTDREKTIIDACDRPDLSGGIWQVAQALQAHWGELDWGRLDVYLARFGSGAVYKRLGYLVETQSLPIPQRETRLAAWQEHLSAGIADLDPYEGQGGSVRLRWRIRDNVGFAVGKEEGNLE